MHCPEYHTNRNNKLFYVGTASGVNLFDNLQSSIYTSYFTNEKFLTFDDDLLWAAFHVLHLHLSFLLDMDRTLHGAGL